MAVSEFETGDAILSVTPGVCLTQFIAAASCQPKPVSTNHHRSDRGWRWMRREGRVVVVEEEGRRGGGCAECRH